MKKDGFVSMTLVYTFLVLAKFYNNLNIYN